MALTQYPAINPTLLMDFANSAKLDSRFQPNRASTATVMGSGGYIIGVGTQLPRFRYNAFTGACEGYLVEGQRTNTQTYSADLTNAVYGKNNVTLNANEIVAPDGLTTGCRVTGTGAGASNISTTAGIYGLTAPIGTVSFFAKAGTLSEVSIGDSGTGGRASFNLSTGVSSGGTMTLFPNGWYRCEATFSFSYEYRVFYLQLGSTYPGITTTGYVYMWGVQVEYGAFASSYIPTTSAQVTRAADIPYIDSGENFTTIGGTLLFEGSPREDGESGLYTFLTGFFIGSTERFVFSASSTGNNLYVSYNTTSITLGSLPSTPTPIKLIGAFDATGLAACRDGGAVSTSGALTLGGANRYFIGNSFFGSGTYTAVNGVIKKIAYWPSKLTNSQLQTLTS